MKVYIGITCSCACRIFCPDVLWTGELFATQPPMLVCSISQRVSVSETYDFVVLQGQGHSECHSDAEKCVCHIL